MAQHRHANHNRPGLTCSWPGTTPSARRRIHIQNMTPRNCRRDTESIIVSLPSDREAVLLRGTHQSYEHDSFTASTWFPITLLLLSAQRPSMKRAENLKLRHADALRCPAIELCRPLSSSCSWRRSPRKRHLSLL